MKTNETQNRNIADVEESKSRHLQGKVYDVENSHLNLRNSHSSTLQDKNQSTYVNDEGSYQPNIQEVSIQNGQNNVYENYICGCGYEGCCGYGHGI